MYRNCVQDLSNKDSCILEQDTVYLDWNKVFVRSCCLHLQGRIENILRPRKVVVCSSYLPYGSCSKVIILMLLSFLWAILQFGKLVTIDSMFRLSKDGFSIRQCNRPFAIFFLYAWLP